jgi:hypothetical protein
MGKPQDDQEIIPSVTATATEDGSLRITTNGHGKYRIEKYSASWGAWQPSVGGSFDTLEEAKMWAVGMKEAGQRTKAEANQTWTFVENV